MWIDLDNLPRASATPLELFQRYGFLNMEWTLGGMVCGSQSGFMDSRVQVVADQSILLSDATFNGSYNEDEEYDH